MHKFGFVFPGQGSQKVAMLSDLAGQHSCIEDTFREASEVLSLDLWDVVQTDSDNLLDQTHITQPALLTASVAIWRLWQQLEGRVPTMMSGHSLGEYSALVCSGVMDFTDAVGLVNKRGELMQGAVPPGIGTMAVIVGLDEDSIQAACSSVAQGQVVTAANFNSPGQTAIAGHTQAVTRAMAACKEAGAKRALPINISVPCHCSLMEPAAGRLGALIDKLELKPAQIPVVQNYDGTICEDPPIIKEKLLKQLYSPVRWIDCIHTMYQHGITALVECGPGRVLCGLTKRIEPEMQGHGCDDTGSLGQAMEAMNLTAE